MPKRSDDDLFQASTMSFGEHLEELRVCLMRALMGLLLGSVIGFFVSKYVVHIIEAPVLTALKRFMVDSAKESLRAKYGEQATDEMLAVLDDRVLVVEEVFLERAEVARLAIPPAEGQREDENGVGEAADSAGAGEVAAPADTGRRAPRFQEVLPPPSMDFVKTRIWRQAEAKIQALDPWETFMIYLKASIVVGAVLASPYIFFQLWSFVGAGLYYHERRYIYIYIPISLLLFLAGMSLAYFFVFQEVLHFLFGYNRELNISPEMRISSVISFVLLVPLAFGISFQLPLVMFCLNRMGIVSYDTFVSQWRIAILAIFVISMVLSPGMDPMSMLLMAIPLVGLYFLGLGMMKWMPANRNPFGDTAVT